MDARMNNKKTESKSDIEQKRKMNKKFARAIDFVCET